MEVRELKSRREALVEKMPKVKQRLLNSLHLWQKKSGADLPEINHGYLAEKDFRQKK